MRIDEGVVQVRLDADFEYGTLAPMNLYGVANDVGDRAHNANTLVMLHRASASGELSSTARTAWQSSTATASERGAMSAIRSTTAWCLIKGLPPYTR